MALRVAEHGEDIGWGSGDLALDFDSLGHRLILAALPCLWNRYDNGDSVRHDVAMRRLLALFTIAASLGSGVSAHADPGSAGADLDARFLDALTKAGLTVLSRPGAVKDGKAACGMMAQGQPELDVIQHVSKQNPGLDTTKAAKFTAIAASAYCPQFLQRASDGGNNNPAPPDQVGASGAGRP
jgi:Protein of unknown function (DUF732)